MSIEIGRSKLVGTQGPGSLYIDTDGSSYIISAADKWYDWEIVNRNINLDQLKITDERLERMLQVGFFYEVPEYRETKRRERKENTYLKIPITRFPLAEYCTECYTLGYARRNSRNKKRYCRVCNAQRDHTQFPIVIVCEEGHISDFPFNRFAHIGKQGIDYKGHSIYIDNKNSQSILNWILRCRTCGASKSLIGITGKGQEGRSPYQREMYGSKCMGNRPWTGDEERDECESTPIAVLRNSLNVYRPELVKSLSLVNEYDTAALSRNEVLTQEFNELCDTKNHDKSDKLKLRNSFNIEVNNTVIKSVNYVDRLQELVVQTDFHRVEPVDEESSYKKAIDNGPEKSMLFSNSVKGRWYPAKKLYGEGVFLEFNSDVLEKWENEDAVMKRFEKIKNRTEGFYLSDEFISPSSILVHTISHALIKEFSKHSGYPITSINERLYLGINGDKYGILIYVTDADKAGTFGGLVRLAEENKFREIFIQALKNIDWCSSDPVCYEFGEISGQGIENSNGSACHNCVYVPDISCSHRNCFLDRDFVTRTGSSTAISSFYDWFETIELTFVNKGQRIDGEYNNWNEFPIEESTFYKDEGWRLPDYYDALVNINNREIEVKYIWELEKRLVLYSDQKDVFKFKENIKGWHIVIEKE